MQKPTSLWRRFLHFVGDVYLLYILKRGITLKYESPTTTEKTMPVDQEAWQEVRNQDIEDEELVLDEIREKQALPPGIEKVLHDA